MLYSFVLKQRIKLILYIHGFRTTVDSHKAKLLKAHYGEVLIASDHSHVPSQAIADLEALIVSQKITAIIASSLGGYYATYLGEKYNLKTVLINPSVKPYTTTRKYLGENEKQDGEKFIWKEEYLDFLEQFKVCSIEPKNYFVFLQTGDEVLDYHVAKEYYTGAKMVIEEDGNHRFEGFERYLDVVSEFLEV